MCFRVCTRVKAILWADTLAKDWNPGRFPSGLCGRSWLLIFTLQARAPYTATAVRTASTRLRTNHFSSPPRAVFQFFLFANFCPPDRQELILESTLDLLLLHHGLRKGRFPVQF